MKRIHEAPPTILTEAERTELDGLVRSMKTEHRLRQRARIVLLAADGMPTRAIGRKAGCTTGTASKPVPVQTGMAGAVCRAAVGRFGRNRQSR
jgi:hypothetical protein